MTLKETCTELVAQFERAEELNYQQCLAAYKAGNRAEHKQLCREARKLMRLRQKADNLRSQVEFLGNYDIEIVNTDLSTVEINPLPF